MTSVMRAAINRQNRSIVGNFVAMSTHTVFAYTSGLTALYTGLVGFGYKDGVLVGIAAVALVITGATIGMRRMHHRDLRDSLAERRTLMLNRGRHALRP